MKRAMGHSMLRKDDPEHRADRDSYGTALRPGHIKNTGWRSSRATTADTWTS